MTLFVCVFLLILFCFCCLSQWFEDKFQEVENEEQQLRKLHALVDSLVNHRKGELQFPFLMCLSPHFYCVVTTVESEDAVQLPRAKQVD